MFYILLIIAVASRFIPHAANFTPVGAIFIFATYKLGFKRGILLSLLTMIICDLFLGFSFASIFVYLGTMLYVISALPIVKSKFFIPISAAFGSFLFFLVSNFGVWLGPWYEHTSEGLIRCFTLAIPFYKNTFMADMIFTISIFISYAIYAKYIKGGKIWEKHLTEKISTRKL